MTQVQKNPKISTKNLQIVLRELGGSLWPGDPLIDECYRMADKLKTQTSTRSLRSKLHERAKGYAHQEDTAPQDLYDAETWLRIWETQKRKKAKKN